MIKKLTKPNLLIIGAMKSGTTSLHHYLKCHPQVFMSTPKELWYFVKEKNWSKGEKWYLDHFKNIGDALIIGESCPDYTMFPKYKGVPERIYNFNSSVKLIYIMRDPVERAISHYWYNVRLGGENRNIMDVLLSDNFFYEFSCYHMQLILYFEIFNRNQIYVQTFERLISNTASELSAICEWLEIDSNFNFSGLTKKNVTPWKLEQVRKGGKIVHKFRQSKIWDLVHTFFPQRLKNIGIKLGYKQIDRRKHVPSEVIRFLQNKLHKDTEKLSKLLDRNFSEWTTMYGK